MGTIEKEQQATIREELTRRQARGQWLRARSDGVAGGASAVFSGSFVLGEMWHSPSIADKIINPSVAAVVSGFIVSFAVFLATSRRQLGERHMREVIAEKNEVAHEAITVFKRSNRNKQSQ